MQTEAAATQTLILGLGNILLSDDGVGIHVVRALETREREGQISHVIALRDGGTIGLSLLTEIEEFGALIVIDAMEMGAKAGAVCAFEGAAMDAQLCGKKRTAHEVALADLIMAAQLAGCAPEQRALVAIQPEITTLGLEPTASVQAAIAPACTAVEDLLTRWSNGC
jgi:hydrogenase maturation protease